MVRTFVIYAQLFDGLSDFDLKVEKVCRLWMESSKLPRKKKKRVRKELCRKYHVEMYWVL